MVILYTNLFYQHIGHISHIKRLIIPAIIMKILSKKIKKTEILKITDSVLLKNGNFSLNNCLNSFICLSLEKNQIIAKKNDANKRKRINTPSVSPSRTQRNKPPNNNADITIIL